MQKILMYSADYGFSVNFSFRFSIIWNILKFRKCNVSPAFDDFWFLWCQHLKISKKTQIVYARENKVLANVKLTLLDMKIEIIYALVF